MKIDDFDNYSYPDIKAILYGEPGSTKTTTACSAALDDRMWPVLLANCVGNPVSVRNQSRLPYLVHINEIDDVKILWDWIHNGCDAKHDIPKVYEEKTGRKMELPIKTVILDQLTGIQNMFMRKHLGNENKAKNLTKAQFDDWAAVLQFMDAISFNFFEVMPGVNVIMTALERIEVDKIADEISRGVGLQGQSQQVVPSYAPLVARLMRNAKIRQATKKELKLSDAAYSTAFFDIMGKFGAKDQYKLGISYMESPTMTKILDLILAANKTRTEQGMKPTESKG